MSLSGEEFLRRFVQHVLPKGFVKARHYGLLANRQREERLKVCRRLLFVKLAGEPPPSVGGGPTQAAAPAIEPARERCCPNCGSKPLLRIELPQGRSPAGRGDTSQTAGWGEQPLRHPHPLL